jgi:hypothetical protein
LLFLASVGIKLVCAVPQDVGSVVYLYSLAANSIAMLLYLDKIRTKAQSQVKATSGSTSGTPKIVPLPAASSNLAGTQGMIHSATRN